MEELGWWIYLCSITNGLKVVSSVFFVLCMAGAAIVLVVQLSNECTLATARKQRKSCLLVGIPCMLISIFTPSKEVAYQILGVTVATEVVKNSEALQELPEKSFEAINRLLDSIAPEEKKDTESESTD